VFFQIKELTSENFYILHPAGILQSAGAQKARRRALHNIRKLQIEKYLSLPEDTKQIFFNKPCAYSIASYKIFAMLFTLTDKNRLNRR